MMIAKTPEPPYYAVVFTSVRSEIHDGYSDTAKRMEELARRQEGFLGFESASDDKFGISVSYWSSLEAIAKWKKQGEHQAAQRSGKEDWYSSYRIRIALVERERSFSSAVSE